MGKRCAVHRQILSRIAWEEYNGAKELAEGKIHSWNLQKMREFEKGHEMYA